MKTLHLLFFLAAANFGLAQWTAFGPAGASNNTIVDFEYYNNDLYATGLFTQINGVTAKTVAKWTGTTWVQSGNFTDWGHSIRTIDTVLFLAKYRATNDSNYVWYFNGTSWNTLGRAFRLVGVSGLKPDIYDIIKFNNQIYACGEFNRCGTDTVNGIARWNGTKWVRCGLGFQQSILPNPPNIYPHQMHVFNNKLYVAGNFQKAGGITCNGIAEWDGVAWSALGTGFNKTVYSVTSFQGDLYAGGEFTAAGTNSVGAIAKWNGTQWVQPGFKLFTVFPPSGNFCFVHTMETIQNKFYITGGFNRLATAITSTVGNVIAFDGVNLFDLNKGTTNDVEAVIQYQSGPPNSILFGGIFKAVGNPTLSCENLALFNTLAMSSNDLLPESEYALFPNPFSEQITITGFSEIISVSIIGLNGEQIMEQFFKPSQGTDTKTVSLNMAHIEQGVYIVKIINGKGVFYKRIIKV